MSNAISITPADTTTPVLDTVAVSDDASEQAPCVAQPASPAAPFHAHTAQHAVMAAMGGPLASARDAHSVHVNSPASEVKPWGAPFPAPAAPAPTAPRSSDDSGNSWGRTQTIAATDRPIEMVRIELSPSEMVTLTITTTQAPGVGKYNGTIGVVDVPLYVWANVTYGGGSTNATRRVRCDDYLSVPLVVAWLQVQLYIGDENGQQVQTLPFINSPLPSVQANCQVARGVRGIPGQASHFKSDVGVNFSLASQPVRLASITAHLTAASGGAEQFLQIHDTTDNPVPNGVVPVAEYSLGTTPEGGDVGDLVRFLNPRGLGQGCQIGISSTAGTMTESGTSAWVEVEILDL